MVVYHPDVAAIIKAAANAEPLHRLGVTKVRARLEAAPPAPAPDMAQVSDRSFAGPHGQVPLRLYRPATGDNLPCLVYFHGGGMIMGTLDSFDGFARNLAAACGALVISVGYRLAPEFTCPIAADEAHAAILWAHDHAQWIGVDPNRIAIAGDSAGGSLAAGAALRLRDEAGPPLRAQLLMYPGVERVRERPSMAEFGGSPMLSRADIEWMKELYLGPDPAADSPYDVPALASDLSGLPEAIIVTAEADPIRDGAEDYGRRLAEAGVPTVVHRCPGVYHGFLFRGSALPPAMAAFAEIGALMRARFDLKEVPA